MRRRGFGVLIGLALFLIVASSRQARSEVFVTVDAEGRPVSAQAVAPRNQPAHAWEPAGLAEVSRYVLNPNGNLRGDGRPDIATNPRYGNVRAVWARRTNGKFDIVSSVFVRGAWTDPVTINAPNDVDDVDPRLSYRSDGLAVITWWVRGPNPTVQMAYSVYDGVFIDAGTFSPEGVKARNPVIRHSDVTTIIAFETPSGIDLRTIVFTYASSDFADGPTPFPRDDAGGDDGGGEPGGDENTSPPTRDPTP